LTVTSNLVDHLMVLERPGATYSIVNSMEQADFRPLDCAIGLIGRELWGMVERWNRFLESPNRRKSGFQPLIVEHLAQVWW